jgi:LysR family transcriptional regulator, nitrogen assimilation regulatory protein
LDLKHLRALLAIAETGSVTRAAEMLHIVQPAVSRQLRLLEEQMGTALFERGHHGMELTDAGEVLAVHAVRALAELDMAKAEIVPDLDAVIGSVTIGFLPSTADLLVAPLVKQLKQKYPRLTISISVAFSAYLRQRLEDGEVDVALLYDPKPSTLLDVKPLLDEPLYLVGPANAGLARDTPVPLQELSKHPLILPSQQHGLRALLDQICRVNDVELMIVTETDAMSVQKSLVWNQIGYTVLPGVAIYEDLKEGRLSASPISAAGLMRKIVLASPLTRRSSTAARCATTELRALIHTMVQEGKWFGSTWQGEALSNE